MTRAGALPCRTCLSSRPCVTLELEEDAVGGCGSLKPDDPAADAGLLVADVDGLETGLAS